MAFQLYNSAALDERQKKYEKHLENITKQQSKREDERQKKYGFLLNSPNVIEYYDPKTSGEGNIGQDKKRTGSIYTPEPRVDDRMSPDVQKALFHPIKVEPSDPLEILLKPSRKKSNSRTAKKMAKDRKNFTLKKGNKGKKTRGGRRKTRKNKRSKKRRVQKRKPRKRRKKRR